MIPNTAATSTNESDSATASSEIPLAHTTVQLLCRAGGRYVTIPIENVAEIMRPLPIEPISGAPTYVSGLSIIRGRPVPVVDVGLLLGCRQAQSGRLLAVKTGSRLVALQVDAALGIRLLEFDFFKEMPPLLRDLASETVAAIATLDSELLVSLQLARIVPDEVFKKVDRAEAQP